MLRLDAERFEFELARRGLTARRLAELSGVSASTISAARHGRKPKPATLARLAAALDAVPVLAGADALLAEPGPPGSARRMLRLIHGRDAASSRPVRVVGRASKPS